MVLLQDPDFTLDNVPCTSYQNLTIKHKLIKCWFLKIFKKFRWFHAVCSQKLKHFCLTIHNLLIIFIAFIVYHLHCIYLFCLLIIFFIIFWTYVLYNLYIHLHTHTHAHTHTHTRTHARMHAHTHTHTHIYCLAVKCFLLSEKKYVRCASIWNSFTTQEMENAVS